MKHFGKSDIGLIRKTNQDSYMIAHNDAQEIIGLVCDGIGGGKAGDVASKLAVTSFCEAFSKARAFSSKNDLVEWVEKQLNLTNDLIFSDSTTDDKLHGMGTTLVGFYSGKAGNIVFNIGDSRAYFLDNKSKIVKLTLDHTLAQELLKNGEISEKEAENHPNKNVLTNALGVMGKIKVDFFSVPQSKGYVLLCTDGLHGLVDQNEIENIIKEPLQTIQAKVKKLIKEANNNGGYDNITAVLFDLGK